MPEITRLYSDKDVDMLTAGVIILTHGTTYKVELIAKRPLWADPFFADLLFEFNDAFPTILGIDNIGALKTATDTVNTIQAEAIPNMADFLSFLKSDFADVPNRYDQLYTTLGFNAHWKPAARNNDQEALIQLLFQFAQNMTPALITEITDKGMDPALITTITGYDTTLKNSNITQETIKGSKKIITQAGIIQLNSLYTRMINIAKNSARIFRTDPAKAKLFSYRHTVNNLNIGPASGEDDDEDNPTPA